MKENSVSTLPEVNHAALAPFKRHIESMKALETSFNGCRFRSRLEARWAVFMSVLDIQYEYEPEGFDLDGLFYLPDFWIPHIHSYIEIKPDRPSDEEVEKATRLSVFTQKKVYIQFGPVECLEMRSLEFLESAHKYDPALDGFDFGYQWCECPHCHRVELQFDGRADRIQCNCPKSSHGDKGYNSNSERLLKAYAKAKSARFNQFSAQPNFTP